MFKVDLTKSDMLVNDYKSDLFYSGAVQGKPFDPWSRRLDHGQKQCGGAAGKGVEGPASMVDLALSHHVHIITCIYCIKTARFIGQVRI